MEKEVAKLKRLLDDAEQLKEFRPQPLPPLIKEFKDYVTLTVDEDVTG